MQDGQDGRDGSTPDALRADLREVAAREDTSDPPTWDDYEAHGEWSSLTVARRLSDGDGRSWTDALDAAGLDGAAARERTPTTADADALRADLREVAAREDTSDPPMWDDYEAHGEWSSTTVARRLSDGDGRSWADALDAAGLDGDPAREQGAGGRDGADADALRRDLRRVAARDDTADPPTQAEYDAHGEWTAVTAARRLPDGDGQSWAGALDAAGLDGDAARRRTTVDDSTEIPEGELLAALRDLAAVPGTSDPPTCDDMTEVGRHSVNPYRNEFGSWPDALDAAGLDGDAARARAAGGPPERIARANLLADVERVAALGETSDPPMVTDYETHGEYSYTTIRNRIGSWGDALDAAGLDGDAARERATRNVPDEDLLADIERVADRADTGDPPGTREYDAHGEYSLTTVYRRLGSWGEALAAAGLAGNRTG